MVVITGTIKEITDILREVTKEAIKKWRKEMGDPNANTTLAKAKEMDALDKINDVAKKLCLLDGELWDTVIDSNKPGGLTDDEKKNLTLQQEAADSNREHYIEEAENLYDRLSSINYTITTK